MVKTFVQDNEVTGYPVKYTVLGMTEIDNESFVVYTNYMPSDNEVGIRLYAGRIESEEPFQVRRLTVVREKEITSEFIMELIRTGREINNRRKG